MRQSLVGTLLGAVAAAILISAPADALVRKRFYGVVPQTKLSEADFKRMRAGNIGVLRTPMPWGDIDQGPSEENPVAPHYTWTKFDGAMIGAARNGIRVLPTVYGLPSWLASLHGCAAYCWKLGPSAIPSYVGFSLFIAPRRSATGRAATSGVLIRSFSTCRSTPGRSGTSRTPATSGPPSRKFRTTRTW
jgi:hypothetical protein